eukprot:1750529-Amphidinium_carterae.1
MGPCDGRHAKERHNIDLGCTCILVARRAFGATAPKPSVVSTNIFTDDLWHHQGALLELQLDFGQGVLAHKGCHR